MHLHTREMGFRCLLWTVWSFMQPPLTHKPICGVGMWWWLWATLNQAKDQLMQNEFFSSILSAPREPKIYVNSAVWLSLKRKLWQLFHRVKLTASTFKWNCQSSADPKSTAHDSVFIHTVLSSCLPNKS